MDFGDKDFAAKTTEKIVSVTDKLSGVTAKPLTLIARGLVYGLVAMPLLSAAGVLFVIALIRVVDVYLPEDVWGAHLLVGSVLSLLGLLLWGKRKPKPKPADKG